MPLQEPPLAARSLSDLPSEPIGGATVYRVWRAQAPDETPRPDPWWFAPAPPVPDEGGRFDLPAPMGTCYTAASAAGAVLEALQATLTNLPREELAVRRLVTITAPDDAPPAADLTAPSLVGEVGATAALWAGGNRELTQRWAQALRRDGWWVLFSGLQHDPSGHLRGYALFDHAGGHPPTFGGEWPYSVSSLHEAAGLQAELAAYGVDARDPGVLPSAPLP